jgi:hypothetical protein
MRIALVLAALAVVIAAVAWPQPAAPGPTPDPVVTPPPRPEPECVLPEMPPDGTETRSARVAANELAAVATLTHLVMAQAHYQATALGDADRDGEGEYGGFVALTRTNPPILAERFRNVVDGRLETNGYYFRLHVPAGDLAERVWCCYAWPVEEGVTGRRAFFVNQFGDVLANADGRYSGDKEPEPTAAFQPGAEGVTGDAALNAKGGDGSVWRVER